MLQHFYTVSCELGEGERIALYNHICGELRLVFVIFGRDKFGNFGFSSKHHNLMPQCTTLYSFQFSATGPVYHDNKLHFVDITGKTLNSLCVKTNEFKSYQLDEMVGSFAVDAANPNRFIVAKTSCVVLLDTEKHTEEPIFSPENHNGMRFNDGKCDAFGRFLVGSMYHEEHECKAIGKLYSICPLTRKTRILETNVQVSNGITWSIDNKTMYYIDSPLRKVYAYDYCLHTGEISNRRVVIQVPPEMGCPDGMTIDRENKLWIAHWDGWAVRRWDPETGICLQEIKLPCARVTSVCWGGDNLDDLYVTTARRGLSDKELKQQPHAGDVFVIRGLSPGGFELYRFGSPKFTNDASLLL